MTEPLAPEDRNWATATPELHVDAARAGVGYNVDGRRIVGPHLGFGRLWKREYWADFGDTVTPQQVIGEWRAHFGDFWPAGARFHGQDAGINPGDVAPLEVGSNHGPKLTSGIVVIYADDESFTFMTPEGHMFAGLITFMAASIDGRTEVRISILLRTNDPLYEAGWLFLKFGEDRFWPQVLRNLAASQGVDPVEIMSSTTCVDRRRLWRNWRNVRHNAGIRSVAHVVAAPFRSPGKPA